MTEQTLKEGQEILRKIEHIRELRRWVFSNPIIKENSDARDYVYLSWVDNENGELKNTITNWCDNEIKKLQAAFNEL